MFELIKKTVLAGIGATAITKDKAQAVLEELVERGKLTRKEAEEMAEKIADSGRKEVDLVAKSISENFQELLHQAKVATREDLHSIEKRVAALEKKVAVLSVEKKPEAKKPAQN